MIKKAETINRSIPVQKAVAFGLAMNCVITLECKSLVNGKAILVLN